MAEGELARSDPHRGDVQLYVAHPDGRYCAAVSLRDVHGDFAWFVTTANGLTGLWAIGAHWLAPLRVRALWWCVVVAEVSIFLQVGLGVWLMSVDDIKPPSFHTFYGFATIIFVAIFYAYRSQLRAQLYLLYGVGGIFLMGMGIRSMILA
jgi:hypothetical protein